MEREVKVLLHASKALLQFIRETYPKDFQPGGKGFTCKYHIELEKAINIVEKKNKEKK